MTPFFLMQMMCAMGVASGVGNKNPLLLVVAFDGMRYDFMDSVRTPFLWSLAEQGVYAPHGISNQMFTVTAPNFFSISTGLYEESHGIVGNTMYDPVWKQFYDYWNFTGNSTLANNARDPKWYTGEPIWQTNMKHSSTRYSAAMRWAHCDVPINNMSLGQRCVPFGGYFNVSEMKKEIDTLVGWFTEPNNPINMGLYYNPFPDHVLHKNDIYSKTSTAKILELDGLVEYMFTKFNQSGLLPRLNVVFLADHGFVNYYKQYNTNQFNIDPKTYIRGENNIYPLGDVHRIIPNFALEGQEAVDEMYNFLLNSSKSSPSFEILKTKDIPDDWHYKNNRRVGPLTLINKLGYYTALNKDDLYAKNPPVVGRHGYPKNYDEMRPFFMAHGPAFKNNLKLPYTWDGQNTDLYNLFCNILGVTPAKNNGTMSKVSLMLQSPANHANSNLGSQSFLPISMSVSHSIINICLVYLLKFEVL